MSRRLELEDRPSTAEKKLIQAINRRAEIEQLFAGIKLGKTVTIKRINKCKDDDEKKIIRGEVIYKDKLKFVVSTKRGRETFTKNDLMSQYLKVVSM